MRLFLVGTLKRILRLKHWLNFAPKAMQLTAMLLVVLILLPVATSQAETRKLKLYFLHTGERAEIAYKRNGKFLPAGLKKINTFLRDWRRKEATKMDPRLLDLIWEVYQETGSRKHIHVISGYRSPKTNSLLRKRGRGVAKKSQHTLGKALDFFIPGVKLSKLRAIGLRKGLGGVGYYPRSGSPFVHMDTGRVRHWPRMNRKELVRVFPKGKTLHVPTDGKPLPGYDQAKREYERKLKGKTVIASAAEIRKKPGILKKLFNREDEDEGVVAAPTLAKKPALRPAAPKVQKPTIAATPTPQPVARHLEDGVLIPAAAPTPARTGAPVPQAPIPSLEVETPAPATVEPAPAPETPETIIAALQPAQLPVPQFSPRVQLAAAQTQETADDETGLEADGTEIAAVVPVPKRSPNLTSEVVIASNDEGENVVEETTELPPALEVAALTPSEIEDLRNEIYADADNNAKQSDEIDRSNISLLTALRDNETDKVKTLTAGNAIIAQLSGSTTANASERLQPEPTPEIVEPQQDQFITASIPVPSRNPLALAKAQEAVVKTEVAATPKDDNADQAVSIQERMIGQWAFSTDSSIQTIAKIKPISNSRNIFGDSPSGIDTTGFSILNQSTFSNSFTGTSN